MDELFGKSSIAKGGHMTKEKKPLLDRMHEFFNDDKKMEPLVILLAILVCLLIWWMTSSK